MYKLSILIRQIRYREKDNMPRSFLMSMYHLFSSQKGDYSLFELVPDKGIGIPIARVENHEKAFVKFLKRNYGVGEYSIVICRGGKKGFKLFWRGIIQRDRFIRLKGSLSPYLLTLAPVRVWHSIEEVKNETNNNR